MKRLLLLITICISSLSFGQQPDIEWSKCFGGSMSENAVELIETLDGGYVVAGTSQSNDGDVTVNYGGRDFWIAKLNLSGDLIWQKSYGGSDNEWLRSVTQTMDGGFIAAGSSTSTDGDLTNNYGLGDGWIVKLDDLGNILWQKSFGGSNYDNIYSIIQTTDGGFIAVGSSRSIDGDLINNNHNGTDDAWILRLDDSGNILWQKSYGGSESDSFLDVIQNPDGTLVIAGATDSNDNDLNGLNGDSDFWIVKLDPLGNFIWNKLYGGSFFETPYGGIQSTIDNSYIISGRTQSFDGDVTGNNGLGDGWVIKIDDNGNMLWNICLGGSADDELQSLIIDSSGHSVLAGTMFSSDGDILFNHGMDDCWVASIDESGEILWQLSLGGQAGDYAETIIETNNGYIVLSTSNSLDGDVIGNHGNSDFWIVKLSTEESSNLTEINPNQPKELIKIVNLLGQEVEYTPNTVLIYQYSDGTSEKVFTIEK